MSPIKPIMSEELKNYLKILLGSEVAKKYLQKIVTPMEEYSLHVYRDVSRVGEIIDDLEMRDFDAHQHEIFDNLIITTPKGPFELTHIKDLKEIIVDNRAAEMIYQGADIFVPGVKRANRVKVGDIVNVLNQKNMLVARAKAAMSHNQILMEDRGIAAKNILSPYNVPSLELLDSGNFPMYFQSIPAYLTSMNLNPKPNDKILDCCAAPGNKTFHLNEITKDQAEIIAVDRSKRRIEKINNKIRKYRTSNIKTYTGNIIELSKEWKIKFDKILIDPPCSSLGLRPRLVHNVDLKTIKSIADYQKAIFFACDKLLKDNGTIVYSTCTVTKEENEEIVHHAVENMNYKVVEQNYVFSKTDISINGSTFPVQRFIPGIDNTLGYFIAKLQKSKS
ncbi:MAG: methyltransferase domain-containing protein [Candidatus Heimdallarchaeaceae archaeon]